MYCKNCGKEVLETEKFCPFCGAALEEKDSFESAKETAKNTFNEFNDTDEHTVEFEEQDIADNKVLSLFAYLGILILVPVFGAKNSRYAKFHISQGVNLIIADLVVSAVSGILGATLGSVAILGTIINVAIAALSLVLVILTIIGIVNAATGKAKELPIIGSWKIVKY